MPRFSTYFGLGLTQHQLDFVDVNNEADTPVYVDPFAIEIRDDEWAAQASHHIRVFFLEVLDALRDGDTMRATNLMSHLNEPRETFLGVSKGKPRGRGVGRGQADQLISAIRKSKAFASGLLSDLSEMALYVEHVDRDKISDLTTNIIRGLLVEYTQEQCELHGIDTQRYSGPSMWDAERRNWASKQVQLPFIGQDAVLLVPKYIVRRKLSLDSQEFYNRQITDFLIAENLKANSSLVQTVKGKRVVLKQDVREEHPKSKSLIADLVLRNPEILDAYKDIARRQGAMIKFNDGDPSVSHVCELLMKAFPTIAPGRDGAEQYHRLIVGCLTTLFYPDLILPRKEWEINEGRKRIDLVFTNAADMGFFSQRRDDKNTGANFVVVECKNYSKDIANAEIDQLIGRFDNNIGKFGILTCRSNEDAALALSRCKDAVRKGQAYILVLTDQDIIGMLEMKRTLRDRQISDFLFGRFQELVA